jgi:hypothetical protein
MLLRVRDKLKTHHSEAFFVILRFLVIFSEQKLLKSSVIKNEWKHPPCKAFSFILMLPIVFFSKSDQYKIVSNVSKHIFPTRHSVSPRDFWWFSSARINNKLSALHPHMAFALILSFLIAFFSKNHNNINFHQILVNPASVWNVFCCPEDPHGFLQQMLLTYNSSKNINFSSYGVLD